MRILIALALVAGCSKPASSPTPAPAPAPKAAGDDCKTVLEKSAPVIAQMMEGAGKTFGEPEKAKLLDQCRKGLASGHRDPAMDCILAAANEDKVRDCFLQGMKAYRSEGVASEGKVRIRSLKRSLEAHFAEAGAFPAGKAALTPAAACCQQPDQVCAPNPADWTAPAWKALDFTVDDRSRFQYSYDSDGKTVTATAVGDMLCDGHPIKVALTGKIEGGKPVIELTGAD